jgi:hypothetical protein
MSRPKSKSAQAEDESIVEQIKRATHFTAFLLHGPGDRRKRDNLPTYQAALAAAEELNAGSRFGRKAIIYAVNSLGTFDVSPELARMAGLI